MNEKQQQLTFDKGITNVPSDVLCSDNALAESVGMVYDDGDHRVIQKPREFITSATNDPTHTLSTITNLPTILYVHRVSNLEIFIGYADVTLPPRVAPLTDTLCYGIVDNGVFYLWGIIGLEHTSDMQISSIGKTLIVKTDDEISYLLWKPDAGGYSDIGKIPEPKVEVAVSNWYAPRTKHAATGEAISWGSGTTPMVNTDKQEDYNNLVIGMYSELRKKVAKDNHFCNPFFVRYALELYDGSHIYASAPIVLFPSVNENTFAIFYPQNDGSIDMTISECRLIFKAEYDYSDWKDVVNGVVLYASDEVNIYDTGKDQSIRNRSDYPKWWNCITVNCTWGISSNHERTETFGTLSQYREFPISDSNQYVYPLNKYTNKEIGSQLKALSIFYKIAELGAVQNVTGWKDMAEYIKPYTVENLTSQERLEDDYYSHCPLSSKTMITYNQRLLLGNVNRGFYSGAEEFIAYDNNSQSTYVVFVYIKTPIGQRVVKKKFDSYQKMGIWFFYPDPRAFKTVVFTESGSTHTWCCTLDMEECPYLNGAYYFNGMPSGSEASPTPTIGTTVSYSACESDVNENMEELSNQVWVSEVNNPFVFKSEGNITIGDGDIIGLSSITQALSQGQFGQYPLIVFTTEGVWAASTSSTGLFSAVHPMSREVALQDNPCITQTDGAVFFASKKGLMVVVGSQVKCVSEQLSGKTNTFKDGNNVSLITDLGNFCDFLKTCIIAYDYRDSLLWLFNKTSTTCYIYSIKSGTFSKFNFGDNNVVNNVVNAYPDYLLQDSTKVYSLMARDDINVEAATAATYTGRILTRSMKLENALALKSIMQVRHIKNMQGSVTLRIFASNNLDNWVELPSLRGTPWKYYRFCYDFSSLKATDRFAGTMLITQERRIDKLR